MTKELSCFRLAVAWGEINGVLPGALEMRDWVKGGGAAATGRQGGIILTS